MGMYTEFHFNVALRDDTPREVIDILKFMLGDSTTRPQLPDHELFTTSRWRYMLRTDSCYFPAQTSSMLGEYNELSIRCNLKNYDNEIKFFVDWIIPYLHPSNGKFLGFYMYEEDEHPTLIYKHH